MEAQLRLLGENSQNCAQKLFTVSKDESLFLYVGTVDALNSKRQNAPLSHVYTYMKPA